MFDYLKNLQVNDTLAIWLYWLPLSFCVYGYTLRTWFNIQKDLKKRAEEYAKKNGYYAPTDTLGTLIGRAVCAICPVANLWAACFDIAPKLFSRFFSWCGRVFDQPLVPPKKSAS